MNVYGQFHLQRLVKYSMSIKLILLLVVIPKIKCSYEDNGTSVERSHKYHDFYYLGTDLPSARDMGLTYFLLHYNPFYMHLRLRYVV